MDSAAPGKRPVWQRFTEAFQVPRDARKSFVHGVTDIARGVAQAISTMEVFPRPVRLLMVGVMMGTLVEKAALQGPDGDRRLGITDPDSALPSETVKQPSLLARWIGKTKLATAEGAQIFSIQALEVLLYASGAVGNSPLSPAPLKNWANQAGKWLIGPLLGLAQTAPEAFSSSLISAVQGQAAGSVSPAAVPDAA